MKVMIDYRIASVNKRELSIIIKAVRTFIDLIDQKIIDLADNKFIDCSYLQFNNLLGYEADLLRFSNFYEKEKRFMFEFPKTLMPMEMILQGALEASLEYFDITEFSTKKFKDRVVKFELFKYFDAGRIYKQELRPLISKFALLKKRFE
jgi:hypothetical protein